MTVSGMDLLIDGYNLLHQSPSMTVDRGPGWTQRARTRLLHWLARHLPLPVQSKTLVVFDAPKRPSSLDLEPDGSQTIGNHRTDGSAIEVRFAIGYPEADQLLIDLIGKHSHPSKLLVVSSDRAIRTAAQRRRSEHRASQEWIEALLARSPQALPPRFRHPPSDRSSLPAFDAGKPQPTDPDFNWIAWFGLESRPTSITTTSQEAERSPRNEVANEAKNDATSESTGRPGAPAKVQPDAPGNRKKKLPGKPPHLPPDWNPNEFLDS
ncbi:MAG: NYN domain-containing protein [Pirellulaceae bacterium]